MRLVFSERGREERSREVGDACRRVALHQWKIHATAALECTVNGQKDVLLRLA